MHSNGISSRLLTWLALESITRNERQA